MVQPTCFEIRVRDDNNQEGVTPSDNRDDFGDDLVTMKSVSHDPVTWESVELDLATSESVELYPETWESVELDLETSESGALDLAT